MTKLENKYQEALAVINQGNNEKFIKDWREYFDKYKINPITVIQKLVDKETPTKPYYEGDGYADGVMVYDVAYCPKCSNRFEEYENNGWGENYCHNCGQRLDWSDTND